MWCPPLLAVPFVPITCICITIMFCYSSVIFIVFILLPSLLPVCAQEWMKMILCSSDTYMQWIINIYCSMDISVFQWTLLIWQLTYYYEWMHHFKWINGQQIYWSQWTMMTITLELLNSGTMIHSLNWHVHLTINCWTWTVKCQTFGGGRMSATDSVDIRYVTLR